MAKKIFLGLFFHLKSIYTNTMQSTTSTIEETSTTSPIEETSTTEPSSSSGLYCPICGPDRAKFNPKTRGDVTQHMRRIHKLCLCKIQCNGLCKRLTQQKCDICESLGKKCLFVDIRTMKRHMKLKHSPIHCDKCDNDFATKKEFKFHICIEKT